MSLDPLIEERIQRKAVELLSVGRTDWDVRHTLCAVKWMKELIRQEGGDERVLVPAIYFHDTGYEELHKGYSHEECLAAKKGHGRRSSEYARNFLQELNYFTPKEIDRIAYLVLNHDIHDNITENDRQLVLESDGFAQIDWENCPPSYDKKNCLKFLSTSYKTDRIPYIKTGTGKKIVRELLEKAHKYLNTL